jgi:hypothetical protein
LEFRRFAEGIRPLDRILVDRRPLLARGDRAPVRGKTR